MRKLIAISIFLLGTSSILAQDSYFDENKNVVRGEKLQYKIKYGWFKIGEATVWTDSEFHMIDDEPHYLVQFNLRTAGWAKFFSSVKVEFKSYIHAENFQPHHAYRGLSTSKKVNNQQDKFRYQDSVYVETYREDRDETRMNAYPLEGPTFTDALGTYLYVRGQSLNLDQNENVRFYIANRIYDFEMTPDRKESSSKKKYYKLIFPPIKEFPRHKTSYAVLDRNKNIPLEIKLASNNGNFFLILDD